MAGTFIIRPALLTQNDNWFGIGGTVLAGFQNSAGGNPKCQNGPGTNALARLAFFGNCIYLDGSLVPIAFEDLPPGFTPLTATVKSQGSNGGVPAGQLFYQAGPVGEEAAVNQFYTYEVEQPPPMASILTIYSNGMGQRSVALVGTAFSLSQNLRVEGTYDLVAFNFTYSKQTTRSIVAPFVISPGEQVTLSSPSTPVIPPALNFEEMSEIKIQYIDLDGATQTIQLLNSVYVITWTAFFFIFFFPELPRKKKNTPVILVGVGNGTQFSGSVTLMTLEILIEDGTGIYRIVADKTNDTFYVDSTIDDTTADVMIPKPFGKTGFIGG